MKNLNYKGFGRLESILIIFVVILICGLGIFVYQNQNDTQVTKINTLSSSTLYFTEIDHLITYNPATNQQKLITLNLSENRYLSSNSAGINDSVQVKDKGNKIFYISNKPKAGANLNGEGEPEIESVILSLFESNQESKLLELKTSQLNIIDWVADTTGQNIYLLSQEPNKGKINLNKLVVQGKHFSTIAADVIEPGTVNNPLFITDNGALLFYSSGGNYSLTQHKYQNDEYSTKILGAICNGMLEFPQAISPNGKKLLLEESTNGELPSDFSYNLIDVEKSSCRKISQPTTNTQNLRAYWSPDSSKIVYSTALFGEYNSDFRPNIVLLDIPKNKSEVLINGGPGDSDPETGLSLMVLSWSPDGRFITFYQGGELKIYDVIKNKILEKSLGNTGYNINTESLGWY